MYIYITYNIYIYITYNIYIYPENKDRIVFPGGDGISQLSNFSYFFGIALRGHSRAPSKEWHP